jgi:hypothetical protein
LTQDVIEDGDIVVETENIGVGVGVGFFDEVVGGTGDEGLLVEVEGVVILQELAEGVADLLGTMQVYEFVVREGVLEVSEMGLRRLDKCRQVMGFNRLTQWTKMLF